jgi:aspartoacylase
VDAQHQIKSTVIVGGTHGNELSGVQAVTNYLANGESKLSSIAPSTSITLTLANKMAIQKRTRFVDEDLNRQFSREKLQGSLNDSSASIQCNERTIAAEFNQRFGPKFSMDNAQGKGRSDFIIDIHNTTSNMGPTLIILVNDEFHQQLARYVKQQMPHSYILVEDYQDYQSFAYLCTVGRKGVMIEVGPQAHSTLRAKIYEQTVAMTEAILRFIELYNQQNVAHLAPVEAFRLGKEIAYPKGPNGLKSAMIHPRLDKNDYRLLKRGDPCFIDFDGNEIVWTEEDTYPHFIGEAAYDHLCLAFATASKIEF